ncbi:hypothetical protein E4U19_004365 [Claviceps sp. Clav32 group G5]|nr:hypothetical protein E4U19_004365 [Claviceps sp. Clav32 group G5]KAG6047986.1 hypothetical protein E4U39_007860 [Claviceps sp. Clav50 group G5]
MKEDRKTLRDSSIAGIGDWSLGRRSSYLIFWLGKLSADKTFTTKVGPPGERVQRLQSITTKAWSGKDIRHCSDAREPRAMEKQWRNWGQHAIVPVDR